MTRLLFTFAILACPAYAMDAATGGPKMIDATGLSVKELMALAAAERAAPDAMSCCDWGGLGCQPHAQSSAPILVSNAPQGTADTARDAFDRLSD